MREYDCKQNYFAGECLPVGLLLQGIEVKEAKLEFLEPQYLQVY